MQGRPGSANLPQAAPLARLFSSAPAADYDLQARLGFLCEFSSCGRADPVARRRHAVADVVAGALVFGEMGSPLWAAPYGQPTEIYPAKLLAVASGATALEPSVRVEGRANLLLVSYLSSLQPR